MLTFSTYSYCDCTAFSTPAAGDGLLDAYKIIADVNEDYIKIAKFKDDIVWHNHKNEDEMFYVIKGSFDLHLEREVVTLKESDFYVVGKGIQHRPVAKDECWVMLIEKKETKHTGDAVSAVTKSIEDQLK